MKNNIVIFFGKVKQRFLGESLMKKLITMYIFIIGIPILIFSLYIFSSLSAKAKHDAVSRGEYDLSTEYDSIEKNVYIMRNIINSIKSDSGVIGYLQGDNNQEAKTLIDFRETTYKQLINLQNNNPTVKQINIFTSNPQVSEIWPTFYKENRVVKDGWYEKAFEKNGTEYWNINHYDNDILVDSTLNEESKDLVVSINKKISYPNDKYLGVSRVTMRSKDFFPKMFEKDDLKSGQILLVDKENMNIKTDENSSLLRNFNFDKSRFQEFIDGKLEHENGELTYNQGNEDYIILYEESPIPNNYLLNIIPLNNTSREIKNSKYLVIWGSLFLLIFLSIVIYYATKTILKRLYKIISAVKQVRTGDLMPSIDVYGNDEVGVLAHNFRQMMKTIDTLIKDSVSKEIITKEAELKALKTQIDSHFLYNTLENIRMMALVEENYIVSDCLASLGDMMRYNMKWNNEFVPLSEEISHIKNYITLMTLRYDFEIILNVDIDEEFLNREILKLSIQPLVENAVKHGLSKKLMDENGYISISVNVDKEYLYLNVRDDGNGMNINKVQEIQNHVNGNTDKRYGLGLKNVSDRIKLFYGKPYGVMIESKENQYTQITLKLPNIEGNVPFKNVDKAELNK
ncbi:sensor histidine kinase [Clostridium beijerinckii]|uniref:histidine kinase n=1 Tax=Clostridium beijerinckii TaxID=1520 RepID=A0AAE5H3V6_CLOBE|nr:sensor histidine kinase [Clostridium beijerinckii]NRT35610.1 two-component system sensor histidine kinase YesM [Clostridium beijerinckii]NRT44962.1 two-component system sensor histidine kinase YesM [Clostridium beijerinckii]NRT72279.1 two-component system sensor histidine kinase YesM [Clostridium beijerinckii]NRZ21043.1 two-component system sensor histidine kinase YesM [Clostridium beijerinckii]NSB14354.1 two-component system sensor histidine kinase YesM [Clostridium beijerinckii]